jgi:hypothetical protein
MKHSPTPKFLYVVRAGSCAGFILNRGPQGFEAFDIDQTSLGHFTDQHTAAAAVYQRAVGEP